MIKILDAYGLLVFFEKEPGYEKIEKIFINAVERGENLLMTSVNFGEVYYIVLRECGQERVNEIEKIIYTLPIEIIDVDISLTKGAARIKASKRLSYADCFAAGLAKIKKGELITGDKEFKTMENEIKIFWL
jgi:PIN domain nuclease of toxin-antitoxin system